jgi:hypothetical protein
MFYIIMHRYNPDIRVESYTEMLGCLLNNPACRAYLYRKAADGIYKPVTSYRVVNGYPMHSIVTAFRCPLAYIAYPDVTNKCGCGWHHMQGSFCMNMACNSKAFDYTCPTCSINSSEGTCPHMCPSLFRV